MGERWTLLAACCMGALGAVVFLALPLLVGLMVEQRELSEQAAGKLASGYFATYFIANGSSFLWLHRFSAKITGLASYLTMALGLGTAATIDSTSGLALGLALAGLGAGVLFSLAVDIIANGENANRNFGWLLATQQFAAAALIYTSTGWHLETVLIAIAVLCLLVLPSLARVTRPAPQKRVTSVDARDSNGALLALAVLVINFAALSALWAFVERIGADAGLGSAQLGSALSFSMLGGLAGALLVAHIGDSWGRQLPIWFSGMFFIGLALAYNAPLNRTLLAARK